MSSPFPGMDPYLENRVLWSDVHQRLITYSADALQPLLRPRYHARIGERLYGIPSQRAVYPDVAITQRRPFPMPVEGSGAPVWPAPGPPVVPRESG